VVGPSRLLLGLACVVAFTGTAQAGNEQAPGALKQEAATAPATVPASPGTPHVPQATHTPSQPAQSAEPKGQAKPAPVTRGTVKKVVQTQAAPTGRAHATPRKRSLRGTSASGSTARRAAHARAVRRGQSAARRARLHGVPVRARGKANAPGQQIAAGAPGTAPGQARRRPSANAANPAERGKPKSTDDTPLTTISRAADRVIEVIPGSVILGMAGLATMVLLLIMRSLAVERQRGKALATSYGVTVEALATAIEAKDLTTGGHIERVRRLGLLLAGEILPRETRDPQMAYGFLLHDIGKLAVPDAILRAPGRLTEEQWTLMRRHPEEGVRMLEHVPFLGRALDVVRYHHERWDGGGYPEGLRGGEIPLWARIFAVVDALDAMTAERPYRAARSYEDALAEIRRNSGSQFDPAVVEALERLDPAVVEPLLEPHQLVEPLGELPHPEPLVAA
jgi:ribonuclease P protein subunit RPR2